MEDFFKQLEEAALGIFIEHMKHVGRNVYRDYARDEFSGLNWDTKKFYVDLAMSQIFLNEISED